MKIPLGTVVFTFLVTLSLLVSPCRAATSSFYVSTTGSDSATGDSPARAFATMAHARDVIRQGKSKDATTVIISPGIYPVTDSIQFSAEDSGTAEAPITYQSEKPGTARLIGAKSLKLSNFKPVTDPAMRSRLDPAAVNHVVALSVRDFALTHVKSFPQNFDDSGGLFEIFANGKRLPMSRWPNDGAYTTMKRVVEVGDKTKPGAFEYRDDRPARWVKNENIWLKGQWRVGWEDPALRVDKIDVATKTIQFAVGLGNGIGSKYKRPAGSGEEPWCAINLLEEIDQPGEWAIDFSTGTIYLWPIDPAPDSEILISQTDKPLISVNGAAHLRFIGLTLESSLGDGIVLDKVDSCLVAGCTVRNLSKRGIVLNGVRSGVQSCDVYGVGEGCIYLSGGDRKTITRSENFAVNNHLHHYGVLKHQYSAGIHVGAYGNTALAGNVFDAVGIRVAHNSIHHAPRDAVLYSGNDNLYELNEIYYCAYDTQDTGAFYSWLDWTMRGNVIRNNYIHDTIGGVNPDDGASGNIVLGNIFKGPRTGVWIASGPDNTIKNNIFIKDDGVVFAIDDRGTSRKYATNPRLISRVQEIAPDKEPWLSAHPELNGMLDKQPNLPWRTVFANNLIISKTPAKSAIKMKAELAANPEILREEGNYNTDSEACFVDAAKGNYTLRSNSDVFSKIPGFPPIPFDQIGLQIDEYRKALPSEEEAQRLPKYSPYKIDASKNFGT